MPSLTIIDVFAGAGGLSLGFEQAGFVPMLGTDSDERAVAAYADNFPDARAVPADIVDLSGKDLLDLAGLSSCTAVIGGPPCAAFSVAGLRRQSDKRRALVAEFARIVFEVRPAYFVLENVPGILQPWARGIVEAFRRDMKRAGYQLADPWLLDAAEFGVPQRRRRVFMVGARRGSRLPVAPAPAGAPPPTARDALGDLEPLERQSLKPNGEQIGPLGPASAYASSLRSRSPVITGCGRVRHTPDIAKRFESAPLGACEPISRFFRLHPDRPAPTIRAGTLNDHGSHTAPRPIHYAFPRCITVREAARLQSIPDWFRVDRTKWRGFMQVGNAVPPLLAHAVGNAIRRAATGESA